MRTGSLKLFVERVTESDHYVGSGHMWGVAPDAKGFYCGREGGRRAEIPISSALQLSLYSSVSALVPGMALMV